jgi:hypothetical protein
MSPRKDYSKLIDEKIKTYTTEYELDEMNAANDLSAIKQMATLEVSIEKQSKELLNTDPKNTKAIRGLQASIKDATNSWNALQQSLKIDRRKRKEVSSDREENPRLYIEWLKEQAPKFLEKRMTKFYCQKCGQYLGMFIFHVRFEGGEPGSVEAKSLKYYPYMVSTVCWKCKSVAVATEKTKLLDKDYTKDEEDFANTIKRVAEQKLAEEKEKKLAQITGDGANFDAITEQSVMKMVKEYDERMG